jgi:pullulanase
VVEVFVRGVGLVRQLVTDPYSISLAADSKRSYIADLNAAALKPAGWDGHAIRHHGARTGGGADRHDDLRTARARFLGQRLQRPAANRGKYLAFTESSSNGMRHLRALSDAGLTDVHLLPVFDLASVPEAGCVNAVAGGAPDSQAQQAAVECASAADCFNWGYDPLALHRARRQLAPARRRRRRAHRRVARHGAWRCTQAGLRVGMDVVYNHTSASGQNDKSVLDRIVPGYYHRLNAAGEVETRPAATTPPPRT